MSSPPDTEQQVWAPAGRTVGAVCAVGILVVGQLYVVLPVLNRLALDWDTAKSAATWTTTAFGLAYGAGFLVTGPLSDRWGRRPVIVGGLIATVLSSLIVALAPGLGTGLAARILQGLTASFFAPAAFAYLSERIAPERRIFALTCLTSSFLAAGVVAQVLAQLIGNAWGWHAIFIAGALAFVVSAVVLQVVLEGEAKAEGKTTAQSAGFGETLRTVFAPFAALLRQGRLVLLYLSCLAVLGSFVGLYTGIQLAPPEGVGSSNGALLALRASAIPAMIAVPLLAGRLGVIAPHTRVIVALGIAGIAAAVTAIPFGGVWVAVWLLVFVAAIAVAAPAAVQAIAAQAGAARGAATALYTFALFVGASAGPQVANLFAYSGYSAVALAIAGFTLAGAALAYASARGRGVITTLV
ncbi:MAG: transporter [Nocardia sp.]|uniref:MFS transporter n=1 Tax=Nocardia sp. TaxID=1821 RepID=UPI002620F857|nr:MFS transporter [Nocardia sp.]MCU1646990.1 transporter [Nocardia sp.]